MIEERRTDLTFDFRHFFGISLTDIGDTVPFGEAWHLLLALRHKPGSFTYARWRGFAEAMSLADVAQMMAAQRLMNLYRPERAPAFHFPIPFEKTDPNADVTPERRAELEAQLERRSAFKDR